MRAWVRGPGYEDLLQGPGYKGLGVDNLNLLLVHAHHGSYIVQQTDIQHQLGRDQAACPDRLWFILDLLLVSFPDHIFMSAGEKQSGHETVGCMFQ